MQSMLAIVAVGLVPEGQYNKINQGVQRDPETCLPSSTYTLDSASEEKEWSDTSENTTYHTIQSCGSQEE